MEYINKEDVMNNAEQSIEKEQVLEVTEVKTKKTKNKKKTLDYITEKCTVIQSIEDKIVINFKGRCISFKVKDNTYKNNDIVQVEYVGEIDSKNFSIKLK